MDYLQVFLPHCTQIAHFGPEVLECEVALGLPQLGGGQLLLEARHAVLGDVLPLPLAVLEIRPVVSVSTTAGFSNTIQHSSGSVVVVVLAQLPLHCPRAFGVNFLLYLHSLLLLV